jgi:hypothetical protein
MIIADTTPQMNVDGSRVYEMIYRIACEFICYTTIWYHINPVVQ